MPVPPNDAFVVPNVQMTINGADPPPEVLASFQSMKVFDDLMAPSSFFLVLNNLDEAGALRWSDDDLFREGKSICIRLGYSQDLEEVIDADITGLELNVSAEEGSVLIVRGYDRGYKLMRGHQTMTYVGLKDSDIARQVADRVGLNAQIEPTAQTLSYVLQSNQTDAAFLRTRAEKIGYELFVRGNTLHFRPIQHDAKPSVHLKSAIDLLEFTASVSTLKQATKVNVRAWDPSEKESFLSSADADSGIDKMGAQELGSENATAAFGAAENTIIDAPVFTKTEADTLAASAFRRRALDYVVAEGLCKGRTDIRAGVVVAIEGLGQRFSGNYYVLNTTHTYSRNGQFHTAWSGRRNAA